MKRRATDDEVGQVGKPKAARRSSNTLDDEPPRRSAAGATTGAVKSMFAVDDEEWAVGDWLAPPFMSKQLQSLQQVRSCTSFKKMLPARICPRVAATDSVSLTVIASQVYEDRVRKLGRKPIVAISDRPEAALCVTFTPIAGSTKELTCSNLNIRLIAVAGAEQRRSLTLKEWQQEEKAPLQAQQH